jgi:pimeloyl-ACP methyl ester carboxylesterase
MAADNDLLVPARQADIVQGIAGHASVRRLEGLGHLAHEEKPALFAEQIAAFCES